jgi:Protein of unknown function (DUF2851)
MGRQAKSPRGFAAVCPHGSLVKMISVLESPYERLKELATRSCLAENGRPRLSELEMQARVFAGEFGVSWQGENGEKVEVVHFGIWNREPGPDFCRALVLINGEKFAGDIEIDQDARDWETHGHAQNPTYENVVLHLFFRRGQRRFFTRTAENKAVPQVCLTSKIEPKSAGSRHDGVLDEARAMKLLEAAASFRLRCKCEMFQRAARLRGHEEALFEAVAAAMGFKNNKIPFLLVAQRASLARARADDGEALLFGLAGFLNAGHFDLGDRDARGYLGHLWEQWWAMRDRERRLILPEGAWTYSAVRPANHPHRRMGALAATARSFSSIRRAVEKGKSADFVAAFASLEHPFWEKHSSLAGEPLPSVTALVGDDRVVDLSINVFLSAQPFEAAWTHLCATPGPTPSGKIRRSSEWLIGEARPALFRSAMCQQGLLQLVEDFPHMSSLEVWQSFTEAEKSSEIP